MLYIDNCNVFCAGIIMAYIVPNQASKQIVDNNLITCGKGKDFEKLRDAISAGMKVRNAQILVYPGVYDLCNEFQEEIRLEDGIVGNAIGNGIDIKFLPGAKVKAVFEQTDDWIYESFQPFYSVGGDYVLNGLYIEAENCRYCVRDDMWGEGEYNHKYLNCKMIFTNTYRA